MIGIGNSHVPLHLPLAIRYIVFVTRSGFSPAHMIPVVFATPGESQPAEIAQPNSRLGSYTYHHWQGGGMDIQIRDDKKILSRGYEHVETTSLLILSEKGRRESWQGRLNCGS